MWISEWEWDDDNLRELARHGASRRVVLEMYRRGPRFRRNKRHRAASHQMIGPDSGGAMWVVCIVESHARRGTWRAITGWPAEEEDIMWYGKH